MTLIFRGVLVGKRGVIFLRKGYNICMKNKLKSEIKVYKQKCF